MEVKHGRGCVYALEYHIVWCTKYRRKVISGKIESALFKILDDYASKNNFSILEKNSCPDHIYLLVSATPQIYLPNILQEV